MGLFHRNPSETNFAGGRKNVMESIRPMRDTGTLIYLDSREDFNTNSTIEVPFNMRAIFVKNGELIGVLPNGLHQVSTENYPWMSRIRNMLTGGVSPFSCQIYYVNTNDQQVKWGTSSPMQVRDYSYGGRPLPTKVTSAATLRVRFNFREDDNACVQALNHLMGDKTVYTVDDLSIMFASEISQKISSIVAKGLEEISKTDFIDGVSSELEKFAEELTPKFSMMLGEYGLELVNFSFLSLYVEDSDQRYKFRERLLAADNISNQRNNQAVQQELLMNVANNPAAGGIASAGAGLGMGMAAGNAFAQMATTAFATPEAHQQQIQPQMGFGGSSRFGNGGMQQPQQYQQSAQSPQQPQDSDPVSVLKTMKQLLDQGYITEAIYNAKVQEIMNRL